MADNESLEGLLTRLDEENKGRVSRIVKGILIPCYLFKTLSDEKKKYGKNTQGMYADALGIEMFKSLVWGATIGGSIVSFLYH